MDNLTHSLVGLMLARAGLEKTTPHGAAMMVLAANAPDIDAVFWFSGTQTYLQWHRSYPHAIALAPLVALLPMLLARARFSWPSFLASLIGVFSHLLLDWTNSYGIPLLLPFSARRWRLDITNLFDIWISAILLGALDLEDNDIPAAQAQSQRALAIGPTSVQALLLSAETSLASNDLSTAEQTLVRARAIDPSSFEAATLHSQIAMNRGDFAGARSILEDIARRQPNAAAPKTALGIVLEAEGRTKEARGWYEQAIALDPNDALASNNLARMYASDPSTADRAVRLAQSAAAAMPNEAVPHDTLGWAYFKTGNPTQAASEIERAVALDPANASYQQHLDTVKAELSRLKAQ